MANLAYSLFKDINGYAIGEVNANNKWDGFVYAYWADGDEASMGEFRNGKMNGWIASSYVNEKYNERVLNFNYKVNGCLAKSIGLVSYEDDLYFCQTTNGDYKGYRFDVFKNGGWQYSYQDENGNYRAVEYFAEKSKISMMTFENDEQVWAKEILNDELKNDFKVNFHKFHFDTVPNPTFEKGSNYVQDVSKTGPYISKKGSITYISNIVDGKYDGILYEDFKNTVSITQYDNGLVNGGKFTVWKDKLTYSYTYYKNRKPLPIRVFWFSNTGTLEVRRYLVEDGSMYDTIRIDKDFNVSYIRGYDKANDVCFVRYDYDFDDVYNGISKEDSDELEDTSVDLDDEVDYEEDDRPKPKPLPTKGKKQVAKKPTKKSTKKGKKILIH